jgi:RNA polymerase sigma-70 factor (sigma-E family)
MDVSEAEAGPSDWTEGDELALDPFAIEPPAMAHGSVESFEQLYQRMFEPMRRLAYVLVDTDDQATDVVQEAFARIYSRYGRLEAPEAYLRGVVVNTARRVLRRRGMARTRVLPEPGAAPSLHDHVVDAVRGLPHAQRSVVVLRYYLQLTDEEIATTLGMRLGTVKSTLHRARQRLREELS